MSNMSLLRVLSHLVAGQLSFLLCHHFWVPMTQVLQMTASGPSLPHIANPSLSWRKDMDAGRPFACSEVCKFQSRRPTTSPTGPHELQRIVQCPRQSSAAQLCAPAISPPSCWHLEIFGVPGRHWVNLHLALVAFTGSMMQDTNPEHLHLPHRRPTQDLLEGSKKSGGVMAKELWPTAPNKENSTMNRSRAKSCARYKALKSHSNRHF